MYFFRVSIFKLPDESLLVDLTLTKDFSDLSGSRYESLNHCSFFVDPHLDGGVQESLLSADAEDGAKTRRDWKLKRVG